MVLNHREALEAFLDRRVAVIGYLDKYSHVYLATRTIHTALLQDTEFEADGKAFDLGHVYVQHAEVFKSHGVLPGDRVRCKCRVIGYKTRLKAPNGQGFMDIDRFALACPSELEIAFRVPRSKRIPGVVPCPESAGNEGTDLPLRADPAGVLLEVEELAKQAGGWDNFLSIVKPETQALVRRFNKLSNSVGGAARLLALAEAARA